MASTITDDQGNVYELAPYTTNEEDSEGYYYTEHHGYLLKPQASAPNEIKEDVE